jgi:hypothetical protein
MGEFRVGCGAKEQIFSILCPTPPAHINTILSLETIHVCRQPFQHDITVGVGPLCRFEKSFQNSPTQLSNRPGRKFGGSSQSCIPGDEVSRA